MILTAIHDIRNRMDELSVNLTRRSDLESTALNATAFANRVFADSGIQTSVLSNENTSTQNLGPLPQDPTAIQPTSRGSIENFSTSNSPGQVSLDNPFHIDTLPHEPATVQQNNL